MRSRGQGQFGQLRFRGCPRSAVRLLVARCTISGSLTRGKSIVIRSAIVVKMRMLSDLVM